MINVKVVTPIGPYKELETPILNIGSVDGQRGLLPNHMPTVFMLAVSKMETEENGVRKDYAIGGGMLYFRDNVATVLVNSIESKEDIDKARALSAKERAERRLAAKEPNLDIKRAQLALSKALNRIKVAG